jgi:NAD(P) transhydrogenase beta subunit
MTPEFAGSQYLLEVIYLVASALFILSLKWMSSPATARHGILAGEIGMVLAIGGTLLRHGIVDWKWIIIALGPAADGAEPRFWRAVRDAGGHCGILFALARGAEIHDVGAVDGSHSRGADFHWQSNGGGKTAGSAASAADYL